MKKMLTLAAAVLFIGALGLSEAMAYTDEMPVLDMDKSFLGTELHDVINVPQRTEVFEYTITGVAAGGLRLDAVDGAKIFDEMLGPRQDIPFETFTETVGVWAPSAMGSAPGGIRPDSADGSRIYHELLGPRQAVPYE